MAIYTQYGRYLKAKAFKEMLEDLGDTYMFFGLGNPYWDDDSEDQKMPLAPYDQKCTIDSTEFKDTQQHQWFLENNDTTDENKVSNLCKELFPKFPCVWQDYDVNKTVLTIGDIEIKQNNYHLYYIKNNILQKVDDDSIHETVDPSGFSNVEKQFYADLCLRGFAFTSDCKHPVGLLGGVKCDIAFVKDIGENGQSYTGDVTQFWYGDRYWEIVNPLDTVSDFINDNNKIYPHHLLINATINPRQLCSDLHLDQYITPRQIAIYVRHRVDQQPDGLHELTSGPLSYQVGDYCLFNVGQFSDDELNAKVDTVNHILQMVPKCTIDGVNYGGKIMKNGSPLSSHFSFLLHDYIKGTEKNLHSVERFGYIIGF